MSDEYTYLGESPVWKRVDRTNGMHTHHCWHSSDVSASAAADGFVSQKCCECPETRIAHRGAIGVWEQMR